MKINRQVGLDGRIFVATCMRRGTFFVFILMLYGILTAAADILKLTGASGVAMGSFTTTLLIYDFIVSLMLVVVVFYAYFLECGAEIPVLREKPLVIFGLFRLGYYLLLAYYVCYHMLYCFVNRPNVPFTLGIFYALYLLLILLLVLANCYIFNTITRNIIRRSYAKGLRRLATVGIAVQVLLPISYIFVRVFMKDVGDEYFTNALCDLFRLCICPMLLTSVWFLFLHGVEQVSDVYKEVDTALLSKRYSITYSTDVGGSGKRTGSTAYATILPAPSENAALPNPADSTVPKAITSGISNASAAVSSAVAGASVKEAVENTKNKNAKSSDKAKTKPQKPADKASDELIADFAAEARKAVAKATEDKVAAAGTAKPAPFAPVDSGANTKNNLVQNMPVPETQAQLEQGENVSVTEFDPFPSSNHPRQTQNPQNKPKNSQPNGKNNKKGGQRPPQQGQPRPQQGQTRPQQGQQRPQQAQRPQQRPQGQPNTKATQTRGGAGRPANNQQRGGHR